jgi:hypothetical protein
MKQSLGLPGVVVAGWTMFCGSLLAETAVPHVSLKVTLDNGSDYKLIKGSSDKSRSEKCQLHITLDNRDNAPVKSLSVRWAIYGKEEGKDKLVPAGKGNKNVALDALKSVEFTSAQISFNGTPKHGETTTTKAKGTTKAKTQTKEVGATGNEYYGYAVQVYDEGILLDQAYSQNSLKVGH